jgi:hypothetical protein
MKAGLFWCAVFIAGGIWLSSCSYHHINHPSSSCGGQQMGSGEICEHYTNGRDTGGSNAAQEAHGDKIAGYIGMVFGGILILLGGMGAYAVVKVKD